MSPAHDPGALLARYYSLPTGGRVRLRLVRPRDRDGVRDLFAARGRAVDELELARLVAVDVRRRVVLVATALIGATETVVGVGAIELGDPGPPRPTLVLTDAALADELSPLLADALISHAETISRARAA
jgi:hypothetical protein